MFLVNSRYRRFSATPFRSESKSLHVMGAHLLPKLRCQFAEFLNQSSLKRLGMLSLPTCVGLRYGQPVNSTRGFSWKHGIIQFGVRANLRPLITSRCYEVPFVPWGPRTSTYEFEPESVIWLNYPSPSPLASTLTSRYRNIDLFSIAYAIRPRLRVRLTLSGLTLLRKP